MQPACQPYQAFNPTFLFDIAFCTLIVSAGKSAGLGRSVRQCRWGKIVQLLHKPESSHDSIPLHMEYFN